MKDKNSVTYINKEVLVKNGKEQKTFKELLEFHKGSITAVVTFIMTNRAAVFLGGVGEDGLMFWLGQQAALHPELAGVIKVTAGVVSVAWNALVSNPTLCSLVISALVAFGATVKWGIKRVKLNHDIKKGKVKVIDKEDNVIQEKTL